jgi:hypothetical protein
MAAAMQRRSVVVVIAVALLMLPALPVTAKISSDGPLQPTEPTQPTTITFLQPKLPLQARLGDVTFHFNPSEMSINKSSPWDGHGNSGQDPPNLEFTQGRPHSLSLELFFDGFETQTNMSSIVSQLEKFVVRDDAKRPPKIVFTWGNTMPAFEGVIGSIEAKYTMFLEDGTPCRATVTLQLKEADHVTTQDRGHPHGNDTANETRR